MANEWVDEIRRWYFGDPRTASLLERPAMAQTDFNASMLGYESADPCVHGQLRNQPPPVSGTGDA